MNALSSSIPLRGKGAPVEVGGQGRSRMRKFKSFFLKILGVAIFFGLWQFAGQWVASNPNTENFADFAPAPTLGAFADLVTSGALAENAIPSLKRIFAGILIAMTIGIPVGVAVGRFMALNDCTYLPFQFLRMISLGRNPAPTLRRVQLLRRICEARRA